MVFSVLIWIGCAKNAQAPCARSYEVIQLKQRREPADHAPPRALDPVHAEIRISIV